MPNADDQVVDGFGVNPFSDENLKRLEAHYSYRSDCDAHIICLAVEEINRLRAEVERLKNHANAVCHAGHTANIELREENHKLQSEVERLNKHCEGIVKTGAKWLDEKHELQKKLAAHEEAMRLLDVAIDVFESNQDRERKDWCSVSNAWIDKANEVRAQLEEK